MMPRPQATMTQKETVRRRARSSKRKSWRKGARAGEDVVGIAAGV
jgi:hypothetical protein